MGSAYTFNEIPKANISRSTFNRPFDYHTTMDGGYLVPFYLDEVHPGDTHNLSLGIFGRLTTPVVPVMDKIFVDTLFFFVPSRLVWDNFERFMGAQDNPGDSIDYLVPQVTPPAEGYPRGSVADYMGIPPGVANSPTVNALPFRCLNLIYNEWFRDENLQDSLPVYKDDGPDPWFVQEIVNGQKQNKLDSDGNPIPSYPLYRRGKRHDYFTSGLPWPQKSADPVSLSLGISAPVIGNGMALGLTNGTSNSALGFVSSSYNRLIDRPSAYGEAAGTVTPGENSSFSNGQLIGVAQDPENSGLVADLTDVIAPTVESVREAFLLQMFLERSARTGTRYIEILRGMWNVISPDYRLQRPELLGGSTGEMSITTVPQTSSTNSTSPQANLAAFGVYNSSNHGFTKSFVEHGYILGFINIRTKLSYQQGLDRLWSRKTRYDFPWPQFAHLGEQPILNQEIYMQGTDVVDPVTGDQVNEQVFAYQERYAELRYKTSLITGKMRSSDPQSLDVWHLAQNFSELPKLSADFIEDRPPFDRLIAVQDEPQFKIDVDGWLNSVRAFPVHSVPGFMPYL